MKAEEQDVRRRKWERTVVPIFRVLVGALFLLAGLLKLLAPPEEFAAVIRTYQVIPEVLIDPAALVLPWLEFLSGALLLLGLFTRLMAGIAGMQLLAFLGVMSLVLVQGIPLEDCGCFGSLGFSETPLQVFLRDLILLGMVVVILRHPAHRWSLDHWFAGDDPPL
ncbi:MAG: DoxX family membrane protein [Nitrospinota bacterium]|nr:MAG: DoxX family membrane protein [Nitrospinota bacterium]